MPLAQSCPRSLYAASLHSLYLSSGQPLSISHLACIQPPSSLCAHYVGGEEKDRPSVESQHLSPKPCVSFAGLTLSKNSGEHQQISKR